MKSKLPEGWKEVKLGEVVQFNPRESIVKGTISKKIGMDKLIPFQRKINGFELAEFKGGTKFRNGDTLLARITPCLENGKTAQVTNLSDGEIAFGSTEYIILREKMNYTTSNFIYYLAISPIIKDVAIKSMTGTSGRQRAQRDVIENITLKLPSLKEQKVIADTLLALDNKIELNNKINENLEQQAQAIFKHWFVDFEFPDENGNPYQSSGGEMIDSELEKIPKGWEVKELKDKLEFLRGVEPGSKNYEEKKTSKNLPFYRVGEMLNATDIYVEEEILKDRIASENDVLVSFDGTLGRVVTGVVGGYSTGIRNIYSKEGYFPRSFIYFLFKSDKLQDIIKTYATGTTILHASKSIDHMFIPYNEKIVKKFNDLSEVIYKTLIKNKKQNTKLSQFRDTLLPKLMSGELRIPLD